MWSCSSSQTQTWCRCWKGVGGGVFQQDFSRLKFCSFGRSMQADPFIGSWPRNEPHVLRNEHLKRPEAQSILTSYAAWASRSHGHKSAKSTKLLTFCFVYFKTVFGDTRDAAFPLLHTLLFILPLFGQSLRSRHDIWKKSTVFHMNTVIFFFPSCFLTANIVYVTTSKRKSTK